MGEEILLQIEQPARYIGDEINSVKKGPDRMKLRLTMCFPDVYKIDMNYLGIQILYSMSSRHEDIHCERIFLPWTDLDRILHERKTLLFTLESQRPVRECGFLGTTLQYEICYANILQVLGLSEIPLRVADCNDSDPIVIGGGSCIYNPEPIVSFLDLSYIGKDEVIYDQFPDLYPAHKEAGGARNTFLEKVVALLDIYVPSPYEPCYREDGTLDASGPLRPETPMSVCRLVISVPDHADFTGIPLVPFIYVTQGRSVLELVRGCTCGCRFCQAGNVYRPQREYSVEYLERYAEKLLKITGNEEIPPSPLSSSDYFCLQEFLEYLIQYTRERRTNISLPPFRIGAFSLDIMQRTQDVKESSPNFVPEAGTQRLRDVINKDTTEEDIMHGVSSALHDGWTKVKLYFTLELPVEMGGDRKGIPDLCGRATDLFYDEIPKSERVGGVRIPASFSLLVPKPPTPFQWAPMCSAEEYREHARFVKEALKQEKNWKSLRYQYHNVGTALMEGVFVRGNRRVADVIRRAYRDSAICDAWTEYPDAERWASTFATYGIDPDFYTQRTRGTDELPPWDFVDCDVSKELLKREQKSTLERKVTPNCRKHCSDCDAASYQEGVCFESKN